MGKRVILKVHKGSFEHGFPVTLRIREDSALADAEIEVEGQLLPNCQILEAFDNWQLAYRNWQAYRQTEISDSRIIEIVGDTNVSCLELGSQLKERLNDWLNSGSGEWRKIRDQLLWQLSETDEIRIIIQTENLVLRQLPWHLWDLFSEHYTNAEIAWSLPEFYPPNSLSPLTNPVRVLAILGNSTGIDVDRDRAILEERLPHAQIIFLKEPSREKLNDKLWEQNWDILFFAGHSNSHENDQSGWIKINSDDCLTLDELENALKRAIKRGLKLAIFNSCDGLGLAHRLASWRIPQSIVMRKPVPDVVAQKFLRYFLEAFAGRRSLYLAVREAREKLQGLEKDFPCASWLPVIYQNPTAAPFIWPVPPDQPLPQTSPTPPDQPLPPTPPTPPPKSPQLRSWVIAGFSLSLLVGVLLWLWSSIEDLKRLIGLNPKPCDSPAVDTSAIDFSSDGKYLATASLDNTVRVLEVKAANNKQVACESHADGVVAVKFSPDRTKIATASLDSTAGLMEISASGSITNFKTLQHTNPFPVVALNFSPDGKLLATASANGTIHVWDTNNRNEIAVLKQKTYVKAVSFSSDGKYLATASLNNKAQVWNWQAHKYDQKTTSLPQDYVVDVLFSPTNNNYLTTASADGTTQVWDITSSPKAIAHLNLNTYIMSISFSPDGKHVVTTSSDNKAQVWNWQPHSNDQKAISLPQDNVVAVAFNRQDGKYLAAASTDGTVEVWTTNGGWVKTLPKNSSPDKTSLVDIAFSPTDGNYLATASADGTVQIRKWLTEQTN